MTQPVSSLGGAVGGRAATTLQGSFDAFPVRDLLALLSSARRTGRLVVRPAQPLWLTVREGRVILGGATSPMTLGRHLLANGEVTAEQLDAWFGLSTPSAASLSPTDVYETLLRSSAQGQLSAEAVSQAALDATQATLVEMLRIGERDATGQPCAFVFTETEVESASPGFDLGELVEAAETDVAEIERSAMRLGGLDARFRRASRILASNAPVQLSALDWAALDEIDDRATIAQMSHRLGLGYARVYDLIGRFVRLGLVETSTDPAPRKR